MILDEIAQTISKSKNSSRPIIIAVDGFGGAGKSTLAKNLKHKLGSAYVIEMDDFFIKSVKSDANKSNFDRRRLARQVLTPLSNGKPAAYQRFQWETSWRCQNWYGWNVRLTQ